MAVAKDILVEYPMMKMYMKKGISHPVRISVSLPIALNSL